VLTNGTAARPLTYREFAVSLVSLAHFETPPFLAVAVSGGADSLALAILTDRWARERGGKVCALTVDHRLRPESGAEIERLREWLSARGIDHQILVWEGEKPRTGIQAAARLARYRLLGGWCREHACLHLLTGHHRDDQIETHLIRHRARSGPDGLAGMSAIRELADCRLLRPLLGVGRDRLVAFLQAERQAFITDPSNIDPTFERSRLRRGEGIAPGAVDLSQISREIAALGGARSRREREGSALLARFAVVHPAGFAVLNPAVLAGSAPEVERLLSSLTTVIGGASYPPGGGQVARLRAALGAAARRGHTLGGCRFRRWRERILVTRELAHAERPLYLRPGQRVIWDRRFEVWTPPDCGSEFTIGYPGAGAPFRLDGSILQGSTARLPRLLLPIFPVVSDTNGIVAVPHLGRQREGVVGSPRVVFRPVNPLTQAGFAVV
jgi:tRNA(Ile)-lysidine synthase